MSRRLIIRPEAEAEMTEAFGWYKNRVPGLGSDFLLSVDAVIRLRQNSRGRHGGRPSIAENRFLSAFFGGSGSVPTVLEGVLQNSIDAVIQAVLRNPEHYPQAYRIVRRALVRRFPYDGFFVEDDTRVAIFAVFHAKRHPKRWQERI